MSKLVKEGQGLDLRKFPRTSPEGSEDRRRELAGRAEGGAARGPWRVGRGRIEAGWGRRAAREPSLLAGLRAAAQMLFCERARPRARAPGQRGIQATTLHKQRCGQLKDTPPHPVSASGWGPLKMFFPAHKTSATCCFSHLRKPLFAFSVVPKLPRTGSSCPLVTWGAPSLDVTPPLPPFQHLGLCLLWTNGLGDLTFLGGYFSQGSA